MFETMSIYSLVLMLGVALLYPLAFRHLPGAPRTVLPRTSWNLWAVTLPFAALFWYLTALWAQASRPLGASIAVVASLLVLLPLVWASLPTKPRAGLARHSLILAILLAYALVCWIMIALFAAATGATFDTQALMFGYVLLSPALVAALLPRPRPVATGMFILLSSILLYAVGIWATSAFWGSIPIVPPSLQLAITALVSLVVLAVLAWAIWQARDIRAVQVAGSYLAIIVAWPLVVAWHVWGTLPNMVVKYARSVMGGVRSLGRLCLWIVSVLIPGIGDAVAKGSVVLAQMLWEGIKSIPALFWKITVGIGNGVVNAAIWFVSVPILGAGRLVIAMGDGLWHGLVGASRALFRAGVWLVSIVLASAYGLVAVIGHLATGVLDLGLALAHAIVAIPRVLWHAGAWLVRDLIPIVGRALVGTLRAVLTDMRSLAGKLWAGLFTLLRGCGHVLIALAYGLANLLAALVLGTWHLAAWFVTGFFPGVSHALAVLARWIGIRLVRLVAKLIDLGRALVYLLVATPRVLWRIGTWLVKELLPGIAQVLLAISRSALARMGAIVRGVQHTFYILARGLARGAYALVSGLLTLLATLVLGSLRAGAWVWNGCVRIVTVAVPRVGLAIWHGLIALSRGLVRAGIRIVTTVPPRIARGMLAILGGIWKGLGALVRGLGILVVAITHGVRRAGLWLATVALPSIARRFIAVAKTTWHVFITVARGLGRAVIWLVATAPVLVTRKLLALVNAMGRALAWAITVLLPRIPRALLRFLRRVPVPVYLVSTSAFVVALVAAFAWPFVANTLWPPPPLSLRIVAGSNFKPLEPILLRWGSENQVAVQVAYRGSVDIQSSLERGSTQYDAVWQGDSLWSTMGTSGPLKSSASIMCSPIVLGVKESIASRLGWVDNKRVRLQDILDAAETNRLRMFMASPAKSNSGALAYLSMLNAFDWNANRVTRLLRTMERTGDSSGWLRDSCRDQYRRCDAMINYESLILEMNQEIVASGQEPMYIVYPAEGLGWADFPLSFVNSSGEKEALFLRLRDYMQSDAVQNEIAARGNRVGQGCDRVNDKIFRPEWGADLAHTTDPPHPDQYTIAQAMDLYQTIFRKPSFTIYLLDFSTSMQGSRRSYMQMAMSVVLDQKEAAKYRLQGTSDDATIVIPFAGRMLADQDIRSWSTSGNAPEEFSALLKKIQGQSTGDMTNIYTPVAKALYLMKEEDIANYMPSIILLTDGESNRGSIDEVKRALEETGLYNVPIFGITFGDASQQQLNELAGLTGGRVFDGTKDLIEAFRLAKGQN